MVQQVQNKLLYDTCIFFRPTGSSIKTFNLYDQAYTPFSLPTHFQVILYFFKSECTLRKVRMSEFSVKIKLPWFKGTGYNGCKIKNVRFTSHLHFYFPLFRDNF